MWDKHTDRHTHAQNVYYYIRYGSKVAPPRQSELLVTTIYLLDYSTSLTTNMMASHLLPANSLLSQLTTSILQDATSLAYHYL